MERTCRAEIVLLYCECTLLSISHDLVVLHPVANVVVPIGQDLVVLSEWCIC